MRVGNLNERVTKVPVGEEDFSCYIIEDRPSTRCCSVAPACDST